MRTATWMVPRIVAAALSCALPAFAGDAEYEDALPKLVEAHADRVKLIDIGRSREGRPLKAIEIAPTATDAVHVPALLIVAGLDGRHLAGPPLALKIVEKLLAEQAPLLEKSRVLVVPCANPDARARVLAKTQPADFGGSLLPRDDDRDGRVDEDGPRDQDGDGLVLTMRVKSPPDGVAKMHFVDAADARRTRSADKVKGETATVAVMLECSDQDGDGRFGEDDRGGVDLDQDFPHLYAEQAARTGPYPLCEPETRALVDFMLSRPDVACVLTLGTTDNVVNVPEAGKKDVTNQAPLGLMDEDRPYALEIQKKYQEITGQKKAKAAAKEGAFWSWAYAQYGVPSFQVALTRDPYWRPAPADGTPAPEIKPIDDEDQAWLDCAAALNEGFVAFHPFHHPQLGDVEIGGFLPGFQMNPPAAQWDDLAGKQAKFAAELLTRLPRVKLEEGVAKALGRGVYEVRAAAMNEGYLPTVSQIGRQVRRRLPTVFRIEVEKDQLLSGSKLQRAETLAGSGGRYEAKWIVLGAAGGSVFVTVRSAELGERKLEVKLPAEGAR